MLARLKPVASLVPSSSLPLLVLVVVVVATITSHPDYINQAEARTVGPTGDASIQAQNLDELIGLIDEGGSPNWKLVVDAYKEYVMLYDLQDELVRRYEGAESEAQIDRLDQAKYAQISAILSQSELDTINETLFPLLRSGSDQNRIDLTDELRTKIQLAVEKLDTPPLVSGIGATN